MSKCEAGVIPAGDTASGCHHGHQLRLISHKCDLRGKNFSLHKNVLRSCHEGQLRLFASMSQSSHFPMGLAVLPVGN